MIALRAFLFAWIALAPLLCLALLAVPGGFAGAPDAAMAEPMRAGELLLNSLGSAIPAAVLAMLWMIPAALVAMRIERGPARALLIAMAVAPLFVSPAVVAVAGIRLLGASGPVMNAWYAVLPLEGGAVRFAPVYTLPGLSLMLAWSFAPVAMIASCAALSFADRNAEEAARLDTTWAGVLARVALPGAAPGIVGGALLILLLALVEFGVPESLRSMPVLVSEVYRQFGVYYSPGNAALASLILAALAMVLLAILGRAWNPRASDEGESVQSIRPATRAPIAWRALGWMTGTVPSLILFGVLVYTSIGPTGLLNTLWETWQLAGSELLFSLRLAFLGGALSLGVGTLLGAGLATLRNPRTLRLLAVFGFVLPGPIVGVALKSLLLQPPGSLPLGLDDAMAWFDGTTGPLLFAWTLRFAPLVALLVEYQLRSVPRDLIDAARLDSPGIIGAMRTWGLRAAAPAMLAGGLASIALVIGETGACVLLIPPGPTTLSVRLMTLMHYAPTWEVSALCLLLAMIPLAVLPPVAAVMIRLSRAPIGNTR